MPAPRNVGDRSGGPSRLVSLLAIILGCLGIILSMTTYWIARAIPGLKMKMPANRDPSSPSARPLHRRAISETPARAMSRTASKSPKRVSFSDDDGTADAGPSPRSSISSARSSDTACSALSARSSSKTSHDPFAAPAGTSTLAGLFSADSPIRLPNILKPKRMRSGSESSASDAGSPTPAPRGTAAAKPAPVAEADEPRPAASRTQSRASVRMAREDVRPPRRAQSLVASERVGKMKRVSADSGELYYSGFENPFKLRERRASALSRKRGALGRRVASIFSTPPSGCDQTDKDSVSASTVSADSDTTRVSVSSSASRRSKSSSLFAKFVPSSAGKQSIPAS